MKPGAGLFHSGRRSLHKNILLFRIDCPITLLYHTEMDEASELFVLYKQYSNNGKIWLMLGLDTAGSDYNDILAIAECLAKKDMK